MGSIRAEISELNHTTMTLGSCRMNAGICSDFFLRAPAGVHRGVVRVQEPYHGCLQQAARLLQRVVSLALLKSSDRRLISTTAVVDIPGSFHIPSLKESRCEGSRVHNGLSSSFAATPNNLICSTQRRICWLPTILPFHERHHKQRPSSYMCGLN